MHLMFRIKQKLKRKDQDSFINQMRADFSFIYLKTQYFSNIFCLWLLSKVI